MKFCEEELPLHGGYGFIKDDSAGKLYREGKRCTIGEGASEIKRRVIAGEILKR